MGSGILGSGILGPGFLGSGILGSGFWLSGSGFYRPGGLKQLAFSRKLPTDPKVPLFRALWSPLDGIWGLLKGSWGVLVMRDLMTGSRTSAVMGSFPPWALLRRLGA